MQTMKYEWPEINVKDIVDSIPRVANPWGVKGGKNKGAKWKEPNTQKSLHKFITILSLEGWMVKQTKILL